jgi:cytochrome c peroxidase
MRSGIPALHILAVVGFSSVSPVAADDLPLGLAPLNPEAALQPPAEVALGKRLFFDTVLSRDGTVSCATCHIPEEAFAQRGQAVSKGVDGKTGRRNSPSLLNVAFTRHLFLDGRSSSLEDQAWQPILADDEMGNRSVEDVLERLASSPAYPPLFKEVFGVERPDKESVAKALASFQRSLLSGNSPFDRWYWSGAEDAMSPAAIKGFDLFAGEAFCWQCHQVAGDDGLLFTDDQFHNTGVSWRSEQAGKRRAGANKDRPKPDLGRFEATGEPIDQRQFKTPSLRNVALTPPYMHDGSLETLEDVVAFYNQGGGDGTMHPLYLEDAQVKAIVEFLKCLTGDQKLATPPPAATAPPSPSAPDADLPPQARRR